MDRGARINVRRDADRLRRSSIQLPSDNRRNQPSSRGNISPLPVDCEVCLIYCHSRKNLNFA